MWFLLPLAVLGAYFWKKNNDAAELPPGEPAAEAAEEAPQLQAMQQQVPPGFVPEPALRFAPEQKPMTMPATPKLQQSALMKLVSMTATRPKLQAVGKVNPSLLPRKTILK